MSNVLPFPLGLLQSRPSAECSPSPLALPSADGDAVVRALAKIAEVQKCNVPVTLPDVAWLIRTALPSIKRRGKTWSSLPQLHRDLLERHIAASDPTAIMFKDWIDNRHIPQPPPVETTNHEDLCVAETVHHEH